MLKEKVEIKTEIALEVIDVWENFRIYHQKNQTLKDHFIKFNKSTYEEFWALKGVSFKVRKGETLGIIGENGSGKSTLLKCISGILQPNKGKIITDGKISPLLELGAGFHPELSGRENIYINGAILGMTKKDIDSKYNDIVAFSELEEFIDTQVKNYSSGMYVRLGFAVAIYSEPDILIIDEVLAVGDEHFKKKSYDKVKELQSQGKTIILVTHDMHAAYQFCDRLLHLKHGKFEDIGEPRKIIRDYVNATIENEHASEKGSKEMSFKNVKLLNEKGIASQTFDPGESLFVKAEYAVNNPIDNPIFGIAVHDKQGNLCFGTNTNMKNIKTGVIDDGGEISFQLKNLPMLDGVFYITIAATSITGINYHWLDHYLRFEIKGNNDIDGYVNIPIEIDIKGLN